VERDDPTLADIANQHGGTVQPGGPPRLDGGRGGPYIPAMPVCRTCGAQNSAEARFCSACGTPLAPEAPPRESRRTVTVVFCDVVGSTALGERLDSESFREVMSRYFAEMRGRLERHGGIVEKFIGDAVMAVFGLPRAHEDDALRAVRAVLEMAQALGPLNEKLHAGWGVTVANRTGIYTGEVTAGDATTGQRLVTGDAVNVAARLEQAAGAGEVLIGEPTHRLVRDSVIVEPVEPLALKGKSEPLPAYRLLTILTAAEAIPRRSDVPMVGREVELRLLQDALETARGGRCRLVTVEGEAGVGKSRLVAEHVSSAGPDVVVLRGRCLPYGESSSLGPAAEIVRAAAGIATGIVPGEGLEAAGTKLGQLLHAGDDGDAIAARLAAVVGLDDEAYPLEELFWAIRRCLEERARDTVAVVVVEDIHWAQPTTLALLRHVAAIARGPIMIVCTSRPDLREAYPDWPGELPEAASLRLGPLGQAQAQQLVERLLGPEVPNDVKLRIAAAAEGNPLFAEQFVSMLVDDGRIVRQNGRWQATGEMAHLPVPPSIALLLAARLDRLHAAERAVIERAAVTGPSFSSDAVLELCPEALRPSLGDALAALVSKDFLLPDGVDGFRFGHALVREAAYAGILKRTRAELHERFARWLERTAGESLVAREELIGTHLEHAFRSLASLGPLGDAAVALASEAARRFHAAGMRALARSDPSTAVDLLARAADLAPNDVEILIALADAHDEAGDRETAWALVTDVMERARTAGDRRGGARAEVRALYLESIRNPAIDPMSILSRAKRATAVLEEVGTEEDRSGAWFLVAMSLSSGGRNFEADSAIARAIEFSARARDEWQEGLQRAFRVTNAAWGSTPVSEAIAMAQETIAWAQDRPSVQGRLFRMLGYLEVLAGQIEEGREDLERSRSLFEQLGMSGSLTATLGHRGEAMQLAGRLEDAEDSLREALSIAERTGGFLEQVRLVLALVVLEQGRPEEAASLLVGTERVAEGWDAQTRIWTRSISAQVWAALGEVDRAEQAAREGLEMAEATEMPNEQGRAWVALAEVFSARGRKEEAAQAYREAVGRFERKGNVASSERVRKRLELARTRPA
jgi:class 3 adenylate cyclase/tetratricopeptide (TPR) repeat protein